MSLYTLSPSQLPVYANGPTIPDALLMDLRGRKAGEKVMASQVELNDGLTLVSGKVLTPVSTVSTDAGEWKYAGEVLGRGAGGDWDTATGRRGVAVLHSLRAPAFHHHRQRSKVRTFAVARLLGSRRGMSAEEEPAAGGGAAGGKAAGAAATGGAKSAAGGASATPGQAAGAGKGGDKKAGGGDKK